MKAKRYTIVRSLRLTPEEWGQIQAKYGGRKWSATVRALLLETTLPPQPTNSGRRPMSAKDARMTLLLAGVANNLNQLARAANTAALRGQRINILTTLIEIERGVKRLHDRQDDAQG